MDPDSSEDNTFRIPAGSLTLGALVGIGLSTCTHRHDINWQRHTQAGDGPVDTVLRGVHTEFLPSLLAAVNWASVFDVAGITAGFVGGIKHRVDSVLVGWGVAILPELGYLIGRSGYSFGDFGSEALRDGLSIGAFTALGYAARHLYESRHGGKS